MLTKARRLRDANRVSAESKRFIAAWIMGTSAVCGLVGVALSLAHIPAASLMLSCSTMGALATTRSALIPPADPEPRPAF